VTRSNSAIPERRRGGAGSAPVSPTNSSRRPPAPRPRGVLSRSSSSTMVFQAPHASQRPLHFGWLAPQLWQTKSGCDDQQSGILASCGFALVERDRQILSTAKPRCWRPGITFDFLAGRRFWYWQFIPTRWCQE